MPPLFMDTRSNSDSPGSVSAEEYQLNTPGSDNEGGERETGDRRGKRREKNRDAARKSRRKQTERADELHEELQCLERSNSALEKEITALRRDLQLYTKALECHEPYCLLRASGSSSAARLPASPSPAAVPLPATLQNCSGTLQTSCSVQDTNFLPSPGPSNQLSASSPPSAPGEATSKTLPIGTNPAPLQTSYSSFGPPPSLSTLLTPETGLHTLTCQASTHLSTSAPVPTTTNTSYSYTSSSDDLFASSGPSTGPFASTFSHPNATSPLAFTGPLRAGNGSLEAPQLHQGQFSGTLNLSSPQCTLAPLPRQEPTLQSLSVCPQTNLDLPPAPAFALNHSFSQENTAYPAPLLPLLTFPSPLDAPQTTSSISTIPNPGPGISSLPLSQPLPSLFIDPSRDLSFYDFLECDDWIPGNTTCRWDV